MYLLTFYYGNNEYIRLLYALDKKDYRWQSGQRAANPPFFFRKMTDSEGNDVIGIRGISVENKTIGYYPIEVLTDYEKQQMENIKHHVEVIKEIKTNEALN